MDMAASPRKCTPCVVPMHVCGGPNTFVVFFSLFAVLCYVSPSKDRSRAYCVSTVKNLVASSHQIWCASVVPTGTPSEVCQSHLSF